jgi:hypothetical protein
MGIERKNLPLYPWKIALKAGATQDYIRQLLSRPERKVFSLEEFPGFAGCHGYITRLAFRRGSLRKGGQQGLGSTDGKVGFCQGADNLFPNFFLYGHVETSWSINLNSNRR